MKQVNDVGVDVDSKELVCAMQCAGQRVPLTVFANTAAGHKKFVWWATKGGHAARVCLEATGIYSLEFALALHEAKRVEVMVVNPRAIKDFARACMKRGKTDALDAGVMLDFLQRMPFTRWQPPAPEILELQAINRRIDQLHTELTREKNRRHAADFAGASANAIALLRAGSRGVGRPSVSSIRKGDAANHAGHRRQAGAGLCRAIAPSRS